MSRVVIELEDCDGSSRIAYLIDFDNKIVIDKIVFCEDCDILDAFDSLESIKASLVGYEIADIDKDYLFDTEFDLIRFQLID